MILGDLVGLLVPFSDKESELGVHRVLNLGVIHGTRTCYGVCKPDDGRGDKVSWPGSDGGLRATGFV